MKLNKIKFSIICLAIAILPFLIYSSESDTIIKDDEFPVKCIPDVFIKGIGVQWNICLNQFSPQLDSCALVIIELNGFYFNFNYDQNGKWHYSEMQIGEKKNSTDQVKVEAKNDPDGNLLSIFINSVVRSDTLVSIADPKVIMDHIDTTHTDTIKPSRLKIRRMAYICQKMEYKVVIEDRKFNYPPGYRRREPILNYPELSMFHYGGSVRMPTTISLQRWAVEYFYWHITNPTNIEFEDPEEIRREEEWLNRNLRRKEIKEKKNKEHKKPSFIKLRPLY